MVKMWQVKIAPNHDTAVVVARTIDEAIAKVRKHNKKLLDRDDGLYVASAEEIAESDY